MQILPYSISAFLKYLWSSVNEHSIHSPFVFSLLTESVYLKKREPVFGDIESVRKALLHDERVIAVTDLGAGSKFDGNAGQRKVSDMTRRFAKSPRYGRLLYRIVHHLKPQVMVELGTSVGISAMYQSAANPSAKLYSIEGCPNTGQLARDNFQKAGFQSIEVITGDFADQLPRLLERLGTVDYAYVDGNHTYQATMSYFEMLKKAAGQRTVIVFDDIHWSREMEQAWTEIRKDPDVTITIDFFAVGLVFFNRDFSKQDFVIRY